MKHLISIIDGTGVTAAKVGLAQRYSNAYRINTLLCNRAADGGEQIAFYASGLGSHGALAPLQEQIFAHGIDRLIRDAYINICSNFRIADDTRDKIYLFGFSRGAIVARALAGLISSQGLLTPWRIDQYYRVWDNFLAGVKPNKALERFLYLDVEIEFLGLFDCVFGNRNQKTQWKELAFPDRKLAYGVRSATHIIAIDEERSFFIPLTFDGVSDEKQNLEQIWMPGVHTDIGGGYNEDFLSGVALLTMVRQIEKHTQLKLNRSLTNHLLNDTKRNQRIVINNERVGKWRLGRRVKRGCQNFVSEGGRHSIHPIALNIDGVIGSYKNSLCSSYPLESEFLELTKFDNENEDFWIDVITGDFAD